jgi:hypothetical protein
MSVDSGASKSAKFITVGDRPGHPFNIFWHPGQPDRIHMATGDPAFADEAGGKPGIRVVFSANPRSVDYNPATFNRLARALKAAGAAAPDEVPVHRRHLRYRDAVIRELGVEEVPDNELPESDL